MKRTIGLTVVCCLAACWNCESLLARGGTGNGGGAAHGGGAGGGPHVGGGGAPHLGGGGGGPAIHAGGGGGPAGHTQFGDNAGAGIPQSHFGGQPVRGQSHIGGNTGISGSPQVGLHPGISHNLPSGFNLNSIGGASAIHNFGQNHNLGEGSHIDQGHHGHNENQHHGVSFQGGNLVGNPVQLSGIHHSGIAHQNFVGNSVNFGSRNINVGSTAYRPAYCRHEECYHGYWNGNRGYGGGYGFGYGGYGWGPGSGGYGYRPYFWGLGGWGLGSLIYGSGYLGYSNPYYNSAYSNFGYNYAQPIPVAYNQALVSVDPNIVVGATSSDSDMNSAVAAFKLNDLDTALDLTNRGIQQYPDDAVLHEFRALVLFAKGDYQQAASTIHSVLAVGPGWDWTTLSGLYADVGIYTVQLRALEASAKQNPQDGASRFLLAYHYLSGGYPDAAVRQLTRVVALVPGDQVAANLLKMTASAQSNPAPAASDPVPQPFPQPPIALPSPNTKTPLPIDPSAIVGNWQAARDDGSSFELQLTGDNAFTWSFTPKQQAAQSFEGTYTLQGNVLALERSGGGSLVAEVTSTNEGSGFNFKMVGSPGDDPGLNFVR